ncbi:hypothetical protein [Paenibacillus sp. P3E]|uniref:hypothetical protein n=1 Tax=Paenibacillus sp. P3E TaxID=1349435 RepID=UPI001160F53A|nr:hypothetical protein [Paenibacillus sp. P3E]
MLEITTGEFQESLEVHIDGNDLLPDASLEAAVQKSKTVNFIKLPNGGATGFLISNDLLLALVE